MIDGRVGFVGGMNLAERYMRGFSWGIWRDTHIMLEGKAVHGLQTAFLLDWYFVDRTLITASRYFPKIDSCGTSLVQIVTSEPIGPWKEIMQGLTVAITGAKKYFYMQTLISCRRNKYWQLCKLQLYQEWMCVLCCQNVLITGLHILGRVPICGM